MKKTIEDAINKIYHARDYEFFREQCKKELNFSEKIVNYTKTQAESIIEDSTRGSPSKRWYLKYRQFQNGNFKVSYRTIIHVSKIVPVFYVQHEFEVDNWDDNKITPVLDGFDCQPYTKIQADIHETVKNILCTEGYTELSYADMNEVVCDLKLPKDVSIFGPQVTVELALFNDIFEICNE